MVYNRTVSPFDAEAEERLHHMGFLDSDGKVVTSTIDIFARAYAGMFFDDLCDYSDADGGMLSTVSKLAQLREKEEPRQVFLGICFAYDEMRRPFPDLIWWISGNKEIIPVFVPRFVDNLKNILKQIQNKGGPK